MSTTGSVPPLQVCTKVAGYLEQGQRLENLSWRLWHLQNLMVDTDNAKSKREFKKVAKNMGDRLDKEKGRSVHFTVLHPDFALTFSNFICWQVDS
jgi:GATA-binding protein, other eukaryote